MAGSQKTSAEIKQKTPFRSQQDSISAVGIENDVFIVNKGLAVPKRFFPFDQAFEKRDVSGPGKKGFGPPRPFLT